MIDAKSCGCHPQKINHVSTSFDAAELVAYSILLIFLLVSELKKLIESLSMSSTKQHYDQQKEREAGLQKIIATSGKYFIALLEY